MTDRHTVNLVRRARTRYPYPDEHIKPGQGRTKDQMHTTARECLALSAIFCIGMAATAVADFAGLFDYLFRSITSG